MRTIDQTSRIRPDPHLGDLAELGRDDPDRVVWIHASALDRLGLPAEIRGDPDTIARHGIPSPLVDRATAAGYAIAPAGLAPWIVVRGPSGWRVDLAVPAWSTGRELADLDPPRLRRALALFAGAAGVPYRRTPGTTGTDILRSLRRRRPIGRGAAPPEIAGNGAVEIDIHYTRKLTPAERRRGWIHAFDANARYLASCSSLELGVGEPEVLTPVRGPLIGFDRRLPGYWYAAITPAGPAGSDGERAERDLVRLAIAPGGGKDPAGDWYTTPTIEIAEELGVSLAITGAYVWPDHGRILEPFYRRLRDGRRSLVALATSSDAEIADAAAGALSLLKRTYTNTIGGFAGYWRQPGDELYRPDWRHAIIASARANLIRRIRRLPDPPFAIDVDAIYLASDEPDPRIAGEPLGLGDGPGAFRVTGSAPMPAPTFAPEIKILRELVA